MLNTLRFILVLKVTFTIANNIHLTKTSFIYDFLRNEKQPEQRCRRGYMKRK